MATKEQQEKVFRLVWHPLSTLLPVQYNQMTQDEKKQMAYQFHEALADYSEDSLARAFQIFRDTNTKGYWPQPGQFVQILQQLGAQKNTNNYGRPAYISEGRKAFSDFYSRYIIAGDGEWNGITTHQRKFAVAAMQAEFRETHKEHVERVEDKLGRWLKLDELGALMATHVDLLDSYARHIKKQEERKQMPAHAASGVFKKWLND